MTTLVFNTDATGHVSSAHTRPSWTFCDWSRPDVIVVDMADADDDDDDVLETEMLEEAVVADVLDATSERESTVVTRPSSPARESIVVTAFRDQLQMLRRNWEGGPCTGLSARAERERLVSYRRALRGLFVYPTFMFRDKAVVDSWNRRVALLKSGSEMGAFLKAMIEQFDTLFEREIVQGNRTKF